MEIIKYVDQQVSNYKEAKTERAVSKKAPKRNTRAK